MSRVLLIEDDEDLREMLEKVLSRAGYDVRSAADGREGLRLLSREPVDIVVTDILMPVKEGIETISDVKRDHPRVKVIAISGGGIVQPEDYLTTAEMFGAELTIAKPFPPEDLLQALCTLAPKPA